MIGEIKDDNLHWYVVHTHSRQEDRAAGNISSYNVETFAPRFRQVRYNEFNGRPTYLLKPLFPSYIFARFRIEESFHKIRYTRGVHSLISFNDSPAKVDDDIIAILRSRVKDDGLVKMNDDLKPGDEVVIQEGLFKNFTGIFEHEIGDADRVRILLETVNYQIHAVVTSQAVKKLNSASRL
jgi:transcription elongation factor/antiterminator RfaH